MTPVAFMPLKCGLRIRDWNLHMIRLPYIPSPPPVSPHICSLCLHPHISFSLHPDTHTCLHAPTSLLLPPSCKLKTTCWVPESLRHSAFLLDPCPIIPQGIGQLIWVAAFKT